MKNSSQPNEYSKIAKNILVLGSSQVVQMGVTFIRAKLIAVLLGPTGMGFNSLILSTLMVIQQIASLGIFQSGIRELSVLNQDGNRQQIAKFRRIYLRLSVGCGFCGMAVMIGIAPMLSKMLFGNQDYTVYFMEVSGALLFMTLQNSYAAVMQATRHLLLLSKATILGALGSLVVAGSCLYFLRMDGIVPAIAGGYGMFWLAFSYHESKISFPKVGKTTGKEFVSQSKPIIQLGFVLMISSLMILLFTLLLNLVISKWGSIEEVGFYQSAVSIIMQGMLISNMILVSDFFPRLSAVYQDSSEMKKLLDQQLSLLVYIISPVAALIIVCAPLIVWILLAPEFFIVIKLIQIMSIALLYRVAWMVFSYVILAKGDKKTYFIFDAFIGNGLNFIMLVIGFYLDGIQGTAIAFVIGSVFMAIFMKFVVKVKYNLSPDIHIYRVLWKMGVWVSLLVFINLYLNHWGGQVISCGICLLVCVLSLRQLDKRLSIRSFVLQKIRNNI